ncbi:TIM barrel protein [Streptomyces sp. NPDC006617]|uniref:TIM barrel protein n=1 Tax=Streptomyces sp. NPDC006617 TaxID=3155354 RepID=UPI00339E5208
MTYAQSFAWWSFAEARYQVPDLLERAAEIGMEGVDFLPRDLWPRARALGLELVVVDGHETIEDGFNNPARHAALGEQVRRSIELAHAEGVRHLSVMSGDRGSLNDEEAVAACAEALASLAEEAAQAGVGLLLEPLNTKVDHPEHQCRSTNWAASVVDRVGSGSLKILYDVYHMQLMEGDLLRTIEAHLDHIGHFHTAGVPGRHELDHRQEVNWGAIADALCAWGYEGFVGHEFIPREDPVKALQQAFDIFDVRAVRP